MAETMLKSRPTAEKQRNRSLIGRSLTVNGSDARTEFVDGCRPRAVRTPVSQNCGPMMSHAVSA